MVDEAFEQPRQAATAMVGFECPWCIAGGWAIDLALAQATREHADVEIAIFREDQLALREYLTDWTFDRPILQPPMHELHGISPAGAKLEFLLNERDPIDWIYRRAARVRRSIEKTIVRGHEGIPVLASEIVLLYKSKNTRPQDELDFRVAREILDEESRRWLSEALQITAPAHPWIKMLY